MSITTVKSTPDLRVVSEPVRGLLPDAPEWWANAETDITKEAWEWLEERWHPDEQAVIFDLTELTGKDKRRTDDSWRRLDLSGLPDQVVSEILIHLMADHANGNKHIRNKLGTVVKRCREQQVQSFRHLNLDGLNSVAQMIWRRWESRPWYTTAEEEWERGRAGAADVRLAVVSHHEEHRTTKRTFAFTKITQDWLREMTADVLDLHISKSSSQSTLEGAVDAGVLLSKYLRARQDKGDDPSKLNRAAMKKIVAAFKHNTTLEPKTIEGYLKNVRSLLSMARHQGLADKYHLPGTFQIIGTEDMPTISKTQFEEKGFNNALFSVLVGAAAPVNAETGLTDDWGFGTRTLDYAATIPGSDFAKALFCMVIVASSNYGRRVEELLQLPCDRVYQDDQGRYMLIYDDFKTGNHRRPLPIDKTAAEHLLNWQTQVQQRYPDTPTDQLKLFPRDSKNPNGTKSLSGQSLNSWWKEYVVGLEQAIVMGKLWHAVQAVDPSITIEQIAALPCAAFTPTGVKVTRRVTKLDDDTRRMMTDYLADLHTRLDNNSHYKDMDKGKRLAFPHPTSQARSNTAGAHFVGPVPVGYYDTLGDDKRPWWERAADYNSHGLPGTHFGTGRTKVRDVTFNKMRHTYGQTLVNLGVDIFIVAELMGHKNVMTALNNYVTLPAEQFHEANEMMAKFRSEKLGQRPPPEGVPVAWVGRVGMNAGRATLGCENPSVHALGDAGCCNDHFCAGCDEYAFWDPTHLPRIRGEKAALNNTLAAIKKSGKDRPYINPELLKFRLRMWQAKEDQIIDALAELNDADYHATMEAANLIIQFRDRQFNGAGINFGTGDITP